MLNYPELYSSCITETVPFSLHFSQSPIPGSHHSTLLLSSTFLDSTYTWDYAVSVFPLPILSTCHNAVLSSWPEPPFRTSYNVSLWSHLDVLCHLLLSEMAVPECCVILVGNSFVSYLAVSSHFSVHLLLATLIIPFTTPTPSCI